jgi:saxitoxin biosynthesis operon SxtJ-like protein
VSYSGTQRKSFREERQFGVLVGTVFTTFGAWWVYRGKFAGIAYLLLVVGPVMVSLGALFPRALLIPNRGWTALAQVLSKVSTSVVLGLVYFLAVTPIGFVKRLQGWDPLHRRSRSDTSYWIDHTGRQHDRNHFEKMY